MKVHHLNLFNGPLPDRTRQYETGWVSRSHYEAGGNCQATEADLFKLLGEAMTHHERMGEAIQNLRELLGVAGKR